MRRAAANAAVPCLALMALCPAISAQPESRFLITTVAGSGEAGVRGDGGPATRAELAGPSAVALDAQGNLYIADTGNDKIRKVTREGIISTLAGTGIFGSSGDGGPATAARLGFPSSVAVDAAGNVYIADDNRVRKVTADGTIRTIAGDGALGGLDSRGDGGPATAAQIAGPTAIAIDAQGNLYVADSFYRIRKVTPAGVITTLAGAGTQGFSGDGGPAVAAQLNVPTGLAVDSRGNVYFSDPFNLRIRRVQPDGLIGTVAGGGDTVPGDGGPATAAQLRHPEGLAVDAAGNLYFADGTRVRKVTPGGFITTVAGNGRLGFGGDGGPAAAAQLAAHGVAVDAVGNLYIADSYNHRIRKVTVVDFVSTVAGKYGSGGFGGDGGPATAASLSDPSGVAVDPAGNIYIADCGNLRVRKVAPDGIINAIAGNGSQGFGGDGGPATAARLGFPFHVAVAPAGDLYLADTSNHRIRKVTREGIITTIAGTGARGFGGDGGPAVYAWLNQPAGLTVDLRGSLYIADSSNHRIRRVRPDGVIQTAAGDGLPGFSGQSLAIWARLNDPRGVAVDASGNVYFAEYYNHTVRKLTPEGLLSVVAGDGVSGFIGDGGPAAMARLNYPSGVAADPWGNIYISDTLNHRIRRVTPGGAINTVVGGGNGLAGPPASISLWRPSGVAADVWGNLYVTEPDRSWVRQVFLKAPETGCSYGIAPTERGFGWLGGTGSLKVTAPGHCRWTAHSNDAWVTASAAPDGTVTYMVAPNAGSGARTATLAVAGHTFVVRQSGNPEAPTVETRQVVNAASFRPAMAPGSLITIFGHNLTAATEVAAGSSGRWPTTLGGVTVLVNRREAPLYYVSSGQINAQLPAGTPAGPASILIRRGGVIAGPFWITTQYSAPGLFEVGEGRAAALNEDLSVNSESNPAPLGSVLVAFLTGQGPVEAQLADGSPAPLDRLIRASLSVEATLGAAAKVEFAGLAPGLVGVLQVNLRVPEVSPGNYPLVVKLGSIASNPALVTVGRR